MTNNNMAYLYLERKNPAKAEEYAQKALGISGNLYQPVQALALAYAMEGKRALAEMYYQRCVVNGDPYARGIRALMDDYYEKQGVSGVQTAESSVYDREEDALEGAERRPSFTAWRQALQNKADVSYTRADADKCDRILGEYLQSLDALGEKPGEPDIARCAEKAVVKLNQLAAAHEGMIGIDERQEICGFIKYHAMKKGYSRDEDITEAWREW
jgi:tetratricopeptide (TPR) repeat protein